MKLTSSVWVVVPEMVRLLESANFSQSPHHKHRPTVEFGAFVSPPAGESVTVTGSTRRPSSDWATQGRPGVDERHELEIVVAVNTPGLTALETFGRVAMLGGEIEDALRDRDTGHPIISAAMAAAGVRVPNLHTPETVIVPTANEGWAGVAQYVYAWSARL